jgi:ubiquinone/menaquinone biosynthesis C-methylase UbiE
LEYWLHGLRDYLTLKALVSKYNAVLESYLDFGCSSGRVLRHFGANEPDITAYGCDINASRIRWTHQFLPSNLVTFQNTSIPQLPLPDNSITLLTAYSIFTHIEAFQTTWLMEFRRILKPGGLAVLTALTEQSLKAMTPDWPTYKDLCKHPKFDPAMMGKDHTFERLIFRHSSERSYTSVVILHSRYIESVWGRILPIKEIRHRFPRYQDAVILQKE